MENRKSNTFLQRPKKGFGKINLMFFFLSNMEVLSPHEHIPSRAYVQQHNDMVTI